MSRADAAAKCTRKTKAVILVHYAGFLFDREAWRDFAESRGLLLIEDAAHAAGASQAGTFGHATAFSFYGNKNMTTAEGGVVITPDNELRETVRQMRAHGMTSSTFQRVSSRTVTYDVTMLGYNYRMDELRAAVGLTQLKYLASWNIKRETLTQHYLRSLKASCPEVCLPFARPHATSNEGSSHHIMPILLPDATDRQSVIDKLRDAEIQTSVHYPPAHQFSFYLSRFPSVHLPKTEEYARRELTLPLHPKMETWQVEKVVAALAEALAH
jgi:dTDP-4-amino-4,6-dideoxygalactose transaminase